MIRLTGVRYAYPGGIVALSDVSVDFRPAELVALVGPNGAGKSTLARLMMGLLLPQEGLVGIDGLDTRITPPAVIRSLVGLAWQHPDNQLVCGVVEDDVAFGPENLGLQVQEINRRVDETLERLGLEAIRATTIHALSPAQKQMVAVAGAMAIEPRYLILDEVTARLDPPSAQSLVAAVGDWSKARGAGVIMITHHLSEVLRADWVCRMEVRHGAGRVAVLARPEEVLRDAKASEDISLETPLYDTVFRLDRLGLRLPRVPETVEDLVEILCR